MRVSDGRSSKRGSNVPGTAYSLVAEAQEVVSDEPNKADRARARGLHGGYSTQSTLKATGSYLKLRAESDMIRFAFRKRLLAALWRVYYMKG